MSCNSGGTAEESSQSRFLKSVISLIVILRSLMLGSLL
ncbi:hypothetical protein BOM_1388 (plasmid) [Borrelia miyamotoi FR64b]|uniref:Uncharacterized protein n=1 Tax=Borrelia miyamotoi FR64b TaxID=1292392 RepID=W5SLI1_9SPIR|nr:hypothetical protein BOM_1388 [Borrelia miyamotoi FR64b]